MDRHACYILAHNEPEVFSRLISALDNVRNDIYVHIDKRGDIRPFQKAKCKQSRLFFLQNRLRCNWASIGIVKAMFLLFKTAQATGAYSYYQILDGHFQFRRN